MAHPDCSIGHDGSRTTPRIQNETTELHYNLTKGDNRLENLRWMLFVDGENFTIRGQAMAKLGGFKLEQGAYWHTDAFLWVRNIQPAMLLCGAGIVTIRLD